jgi:uncharacterized protein
MTVNAFSFVGMYAHALDGAAHLLAKGAEHAAANGVSDNDMLDWRLIEDMQPLRFQLMVVCNFTRQWPARVAGLPLPESVGAELDLAGFKAAVADAKTYLAALTPEQFESRDETPLTIPIGDGEMKPTLPAGRWLTVFATTNIYFHLSTAYDILRAKGVPIGKMDLFAGGL